MNLYRELKVWQVGCELVIKIYELTAKFPPSEQFGLTAQMRRAAVSIPSNIAEGYSRRTVADNRNFVRIAFASGAELETQVYLAEKLKLTKADEFIQVNDFLSQVMKMLNTLGSRLC
ncbi:MAG: four helix bundle protein [Candidatus Kerfeldbacteria bacterium]|nr:four helix bundle protein [Candidatus Kerfeldbacteria bacterium]